MTRPRQHPGIWLGPGRSPVALYLEQEHAAWRTMAEDLRDATAEAEHRIIALGARRDVGAQVRRSQMALIRRQLLIVQTQLWALLGQRARVAGPTIADAAARAEHAMEEVLFRAVGRTVPEPLLRAQHAAAQRVVEVYLARRRGQWTRSQALSQQWLDRVVNREILTGSSWLELARVIRPVMSPDVPGGVSYAAKRVARTELNNSFHEANRQAAQRNPYVTGMRWRISATHQGPDVCDRLARGHSRGRPRGVYALGAVPDKPHPQCLCYATPEMMSETEFLRTLARAAAA